MGFTHTKQKKGWNGVTLPPQKPPDSSVILHIHVLHEYVCSIIIISQATGKFALEITEENGE